MQYGPHDERPPLAWAAVLPLVAIKLALSVSVLTRYGWFRDELYYVASTRHLALGYVDHPPLSIALLAGWTGIFGESLAAIRMLAALIGASSVLLAAFIARELGGRAFAQFLAALAVLAAPMFLGTQFFFSMNGLDQALSALAILLYARWLRTGNDRTALWLGAALGVALLNKLSTLWLVAGMLAGLVLTRQRVLLGRRSTWAAIGITALVAMPHFLWQVFNGFPTIEFIRNAAEHKMVRVSPVEFWANQLRDTNPFNAALWLAGILAPFLVAPLRRFAPVSVLFVTVAAILMANASKTYYLGIAYFGVLAAGAVWLERATGGVPGHAARGALVLLIAAYGVVTAPLAVPLFSPQGVNEHLQRLGLDLRSEERHETPPLPQHFADMHGWPELVDAVDRATARLAPEERSGAVVFGQNYGEAGAVDVLGRARGLPPAISGHNSYWMWGPGRDSVRAVIVIGGDLEDNVQVFEQFEIVDSTDCDLCMPYENRLPIGIGRGLRQPIRELWPGLRKFI
jgi:4-amino-4-deoxy-L-arabinose transferase-like glycosyltransferase